MSKNAWAPHGLLILAHVALCSSFSLPTNPSLQSGQGLHGMRASSLVSKRSLMTVMGSVSHSGVDDLPATFKALIAANGVGESFRSVASIKELPMKLPEDGQVVVQIKYAGINGGCETFRARGEAGFARNKQRPSFELGAEGSGVVVAVGTGVSLSVNDAVAFVSGGGGFAQYLTLGENMCTRVPEASAEAAALRISGVSGYGAAVDKGGAKRGETVLVTAAAGGSGQFAVQGAKLAGCTVIGTCGSAEKAKLLCALGCDTIINHKTKSVTETVNKMYPGGVDLVVEHVGGKMLEESLGLLKPNGRLVMVGYISGYPHNTGGEGGSSKLGFDEADLFWNAKTIKRGEQTIYGNIAGISGATREEVFKLHKEGKLKAVIDQKKFEGLEAVPDAIEYMLSGQSMGKVVVKIQD